MLLIVDLPCTSLHPVHCHLDLNLYLYSPWYICSILPLFLFLFLTTGVQFCSPSFTYCMPGASQKQLVYRQPNPTHLKNSLGQKTPLGQRVLVDYIEARSSLDSSKKNSQQNQKALTRQLQANMILLSAYDLL